MKKTSAKAPCGCGRPAKARSTSKWKASKPYGIGTTFEVQTPAEMIWRLDAPADARVFVQRMFGTSFECEGETFTNIDRMPHESESMAEVTRARRMLELERRSFLAEVRAENAAISAQLAAKREAASEDIELVEPKPGEEVSA